MIEERRRRDAPDAGFTLIELLVALMIVAILTGISVPSYVGMMTSVRESATQADLGGDRSALVAYGIDNNGLFPPASTLNTTTGSVLAGYGWQKSPETQQLTYSTNTDRSSWCLQATSVTGTVYRTSPGHASAEGTCSALGAANY